MGGGILSKFLWRVVLVMNTVLKSILKTAGLIIVINLILSLAYIFSFGGLIANDSGERPENKLYIIFMILIFTAPFFGGSIICGDIARRKYQLNMPAFWIVQLLLILPIISGYISLYMPNTWVANQINLVTSGVGEINKSLNSKTQSSKNESLASEMNDKKYTELDKIKHKSTGDSISVSVANDNSKLIAGYIYNNKTYYIDYEKISDEQYKALLQMVLDPNIKPVNNIYYKINPKIDYQIIDVNQDFLVLQYKKIKYLIYAKFSTNYSDAQSITSKVMDKHIFIDGKGKINLGEKYRDYLMESISNGEGIYSLKGMDYIEIQRTGNVIEVKPEYLRVDGLAGERIKYGWTLTNGGKLLLSRSMVSGDYNLSLDDIKQLISDKNGKYEIFLTGYVNGKYIKVSNIINL